MKLQHPNIVSVIDFGEEESDWFLALELVEGVTASELVKHAGPLPVEEALTVVERVARALAYAHTLEEDGRPLNIVHRDVKAANILISTRGEVKLTDFGIARAANRVSRTAVGVIKGSASTLSPEQVREEPLDARSDLFALGATLHYLLVGSPLFDLPLDRLLQELENDQIPSPPSHLPPKIRQLLQALTAPERRKRPASAADVAKAIRLILAPTSPDDVEPAIAARVRAARERLGRAPDRESRPSGRAAAVPAPASAPATPVEDVADGDDLSLTTRRSEAVSGPVAADPPKTAEHPAFGSEDDLGRDTRPSKDRPQHPEERPGFGAEDDLERTTRRSADRPPTHPPDERSSDAFGRLLPEGDGLDERFDEETELGPSLSTSRIARAAEPPEPRPPTRRADPSPSVVPTRLVAPSPRGAEDPAPEITEDVPVAHDPAGDREPDVRPRSMDLPDVAGPSPPIPPRSQELVRVARPAERTRGPSRLALGIFATAVAVIAMVAVPVVQSRVTTARCESAPSRLAADFETLGARAVADAAARIERGCPPSRELRALRLRALAYAGEPDAALALLPPAAARDAEESLTAAALALAAGDARAAESGASKAARAAAAGAAAPAACLAAAAAIDQDAPERAEDHLRGIEGDCARILRAAAAVQQGETGRAFVLLGQRPRGLESRAAHESALGRIHLLVNDQDAANADAQAAWSEAKRDPLSPQAWIWYTTHSPRGGPAMSLRVTGPMDDPVLYTGLLRGDTARARGSLDLAISLYDEAASRGGRTAIAEVRAASVMVQQGRPQLARGRLARAISIDPTFAPALVQLAIIDARTDPASAAKHAAAALKLQPGNRDALRIAGR